MTHETETLVLDEALLIRNPDVVLREEDPDGALLFNPDTNHVRVLNATGTHIWHCCDGTSTITQVAASIRQAFDDVPSDEVQGQVHEFVQEMVASGFLGIVAEEPVTTSP